MDFLVNYLASVFYKVGNVSIFAFAVINLIVWVLTRISLKKAEKMFYPKSDKTTGVSASMPWTKEEISDLKKMRKDLVIEYAWYANITAIFPLLGILGTVAALFTYSDETMMENFMVALSTTLLGVFFAIFFKGIDAIISGPMDVFIDNADHVIQDEEKRHRNEA